MADHILDKLNKKQRDAVKAGEGPLLIVAGAGSGKTKALTHRIAYLLSQGEKPENIIALTFTNRAADEMRERVRKLLRAERSGRTSMPFIGTFHSLGVRILRTGMATLGRKNNFVIYDEKDRRALIKEIAVRENIPDRFQPGAIASAISAQKNELVSSADYAERAAEPFEKMIARVFANYEQMLVSANAVDFDDLLALPIKIFEGAPAILARYQNRFHHILVDEYQDTNHAQYVFLNLLAGQRQNLSVVGDDWQAIYGFRGADFRNILEFEKDYPEAKVVLLEENYRSSQTILDAAQAVIEKNVQRTNKKLWTSKKGGDKVRIVGLNTELEEAAFVLDEIERLVERGEGLSGIAVLYRTNAQSRAVEEAFVERALAYKTIGSVRFWERREVKDIIAYLRILQNPSDTASLKRVANVPPRGIGKVSLEKFFVNGTENAPVKNFFALLDELRGRLKTSGLGEVVETLLKKIQYAKYINDGTPGGAARWENVQELMGVVGKFDDLSARDALQTLLEELALMAPVDEIDTSQDQVHLMTLHSAKGLEFNVVFVVGCEEGLFPHERSILNPAKLEEERRLFYVGITRAKRRVYLVFTRRRNLYGTSRANLPSRFLADIPERLVDFISYDKEGLDVIEI